LLKAAAQPLSCIGAERLLHTAASQLQHFRKGARHYAKPFENRQIPQETPDASQKTARLQHEK
jgi:hypothetical protein